MRIKEKLTDNIIADRSIRDRCVGHYEVLEKVKKLLLLPGTELSTVKQVAEFYEVGEKAIQSLYFDHMDELDSDGTQIKSPKEFLNLLEGDLKTGKGKAILIMKNNETFEIPNRGLRVFPRRAILRVGMLLRDSVIAKEVRTQLLNIEEKASNKTKTHDIDEEQTLMLNIGMAYASGNIEAVIKATTEYNAFQNRHIQKLENDNKALAEGILEWCDRNKLNAGIRQLASVTGIHFSKMWNELYKNLQYKYGICVKQRGDTPYIQWIDESEWDDVMKTFCAMCEAYGQSPTEMLQQTTPVGNLKKAN